MIGGGAGGGVALLVLLLLFLLSGNRQEQAQNEKNNAHADVSGQNVNKSPFKQQAVEPVNLVSPFKGTDPFADLKPVSGTPRLVLDPVGHSSVVKELLFTPDGNQLISVSMDKTIRVWDLTTGETVRILRPPIGPGKEGELLAAALTPDGKHLAVGGHPVGNGANGWMIYVISLDSGQIEKVLKGHTGNISGLDYSSDGTLLVSSSMDTTARIHDLANGNTVNVYKGHTGSIRSVSFSPDDQCIATTSYDNTVRIWSVASGQPTAVIGPLPGKLISHAWSHSGQMLATGCMDATIQLWDRNGRQLKNYKITNTERTQVVSMNFTNDDSEILYTGIDYTGRAGIFNLQTGKRRIIFTQHNNTVFTGALSADGQFAATTGGNDMDTFVWRVDDGSVVHKIVGKGRGIWGVGWSRDSKQIAWGNLNKHNGNGISPIQYSFDMTKLQFGKTPTRPEFVQVPSGTKTGYSLHRIDFFKIAVKHNGQTVQVLQAPQNRERVYSFSVVTNDWAVLGGSFANYLVDMKTGRVLRTFKGHNGIVPGIAPSPNGKYVLSGSGDQTLMLWSIYKDEPLMTLFFAGRNWIAWTPEGYYACSAYGERLMGWQVNNGPGKMATFHPAVRFRKSLYRPDVLKLLFETGDLQKALAKAEQQKNQPVQQVNVAQVLPPQVMILDPHNLNGVFTTAENKITIHAAAKSVGEHPVTSMRLLIDGRPYQGANSVIQLAAAKPGLEHGSWLVELTPGDHALQVQADSAVSKAVSQPVYVRYMGDSEHLPNLYVLAVGVSEYPGEMRLNYAHADAIKFANVFQRKTGGVFNKVNVNLLTDSQATRDNILQGMANLKSKMTAGDVGIIFFAGHGMKDPSGTFHFLPVDVRMDNPDRTCVSGEVIKKTLANTPGKLVAVFDACQSGAVIDDLVRDLVTEEYGVVVMCSSLGSEFSMESPLLRHGFFTFGLVEGLNGSADFNNDQIVFINELAFYAAKRVQTLTQGMQNPILGRPPMIRPFALTKR